MTGPTILTVPGGPIPFVAVRGLLRQLPTLGELPLPSFITHRPRPGRVSLNDRRDFKSQLRFRNAWHVLGELGPVARKIDATCPGGLRVTTYGELNPADTAALAIIGKHTTLTVEWSPGSRPPTTPPYDPGTTDVLTDRQWVEDTFPIAPDWEEFRRRIGRYLACSDSWTAVWLIDIVLGRTVTVPPEIADMIGLAYQMAGRPQASETFRQLATRAGGRLGAQAYNSLAMLYARHHPPALRDLDRAEACLGLGWDILAALHGAELDRALNRNALAYVLMRQHRMPEAITSLVRALSLVADDDLASAILYNNLGRLYGVDGHHELAEEYLLQATELDPLFPEHHLDLAHHLARTGQHDRALAVANRAEELMTGSIAAIPALVGYLHSHLGAPAQAAAAYARAYRIEPDNADHLIAAVREACDASDPDSARSWLACIDQETLTPYQQSEVELLRLWADTRAGDVTPETAHRTLLSLGERYPASKLIRRNIEVQKATPT